MNEPNMGEYGFSVLFPALKIGVEDSINPCGIAAALIFVILCSYFGYRQRHIFWLGTLFIASAVGTQHMLGLGYWDLVLTAPFIFNFIRTTYLILAVTFIILGALNISDWRKYKKHLDIECFRLKLPVFFQDYQKNRLLTGKHKVLRVINIILFTAFTGFVVTLMGSIYPQNEYVFILHSFLLSGGDRGFVYTSFFLYSLAMNMPTIAAWLTIIWLTRKKKKNVRALLYFKGVISALFFSTGIGLGYFYLSSSMN